MMTEETSFEDELSQSSGGLVLNFADDHWRIQHLKVAFLHSVRQRCPLVIHGPPGNTGLTDIPESGLLGKYLLFYNLIPIPQKWM